MANTTREARAGRVAVGGQLTIYTAAEAKPGLIDPLAEGAELEYDLSAVGEIDTAGLQLLLLVKREAAARGVTVRFTHHTPPVVDLIDLFDLGAWFGDPMLIHASAPGAGHEPG